MCGIYCSSFQNSQQRIQDKLACIKYRGPDNTGFCVKDNITFGHNRLSILDLDPRSNQPFTYGHITLVYNGESYNFQKLREELKAKNYSFTTESDTEVICALYLEYGEKCVELLNGMFALVIYDSKEQQLFFAKDRLGQKPLYYRFENGAIEIASQIKQIEIGNQLTVDHAAGRSFFKYKYIPEPHSIYQEVKKLPAGHYGVLDLRNKKLSISKYWDLPNIQSGYKGDYATAQIELEQKLQQAVDYRLIADVPVGVFLSGGVDSSLITALAQKSSGQKINTFCVAFNSSKFDESNFAKEIADYLGTNHTTINCSMKEASEMVYSIAQTFDEPFADASAIPTMLLSKVTRNHVTVALSGDGGDESFIGYNRYDAIAKYNWIYKMPKMGRSALASAMRVAGNRKVELIASILDEASIGSFYHRMIQPIDQKFLKDVNGQIDFLHLNRLEEKVTSLEKVSRFDIKTYLSDDINVKVDRASMQYSLETRAPLLDYEVVEFAQHLPLNYKYHKGIKKRILKDVLYKHVPRKLVERPKSGFSMPLEIWFRTHLKEWTLDLLTEDNLKSIPFIDAKEVLLQVNRHMEGKANRYDLIWKLLVYTMWLKR